MNSKLAAILKIGEAVAVSVIPGAKVVDQIAHDIHDHKKVDVVGELPELSLSVIQIVESVGEHDIADEVMFHDGVSKLTEGFKLVEASLKHRDGTPEAHV